MKINVIEHINSIFKNPKIKYVSKNKIKVHYETSNKLAKPKPIILPAYVNLDENLVEGLGLYIGDGKLTPNDLKHTELSTIDKDIAKFFLDFLRNRFYINTKDISFSIRYRFGNENDLKKKWSKILNVNKNKLVARKKDEYKMRDSITFQINSIIFTKLFRRIIDVSLKLMKKDGILRKAFLKGEFASDGKFGVERDTNSYYISEISFCFDAKKELWLRDYIIECLKLEGIKRFNLIPGYIRITGWDNYIKFWSMSLFDLCERKGNKFSNVVRQSHVHFQLDLVFLNSIINSLDLTTTGLTKLLNLHRTNLKRIKVGEQLLTIEQIYKILQKSGLRWKDIIKHTKRIRIGKLTKLKPEIKFIDFLINEKNLN